MNIAPTLTNKDILERVNFYPQWAKDTFWILRELIFYAANKNGLSVDQVTETTKWAEPAYITEKGSAIRLDWKSKAPNQFCIFFNCKTKLVSTYFDIYKDLFSFEKNRAILLHKDQDIPQKELIHCFALSLNYHSIKNQL